MNEQLDSALLERFNEGDENAFRQIFDHLYPALFHFTHRITSSKEEAEDISLRAFQKLFERHPHFNSEANIKAFLYITARNNSFNYLKSQKRQREKQAILLRKMKDDTWLLYEYEIKGNLVDAINNAINALPEECGKVFKMLYYQEMKPAEIANILGISVSTVYNQKSLAIQKLRIMLVDNSMAIVIILFSMAALQYDVLSRSCGIDGRLHELLSQVSQ